MNFLGITKIKKWMKLKIKKMLIGLLTKNGV